MNGIMIIPTGLNCALGGDAAYAPGIKLIAACCDKLIVNPNAVNASDINEIPNNGLYVEGSMIDRFLEGSINLQEVKTYNRILMVVNGPIKPYSINSLNAGIWSLGAKIQLMALKTPLKMTATLNSDGTAGGTYSGIEELIEQVSYHDFDALAIQTPIECDDKIANYYWDNGGVNPWGGIEAIVSKIISNAINKPVAHAPIETGWNDTYSKKIVKRSMAPEIISNTYTFCILKGLLKAPRVSFDSSDLSSKRDIDFLLSPHGIWGRPHEAARRANIPVIVVNENTTCFSKNFVYYNTKGIIFVDNYLEAAGVITSLKAGVDPTTVTLEK